MKKRLFFLTESYPYGNGEQFIQVEMEYLAARFDEVIILPMLVKSSERNITFPENVTVFPGVISRNKQRRYLKGIFNLSSVTLLFKLFFEERVYRDLGRLKQWFITFSMVRTMLASPSFRFLEKEAKEGDVIYSYWGVGFAYLIPFLREVKAKKIARLHGGDLYEYRQNGYIPLRKQLFSVLDYILPVSVDGAKYLKTKYPPFFDKVQVFKLGTKDFGLSRPSEDGVFRIVSCSSLVPIKRVDRIINALQLIEDRKIEWTHIGSGVLYDEIQRQAQLLSDNISVNFIGRLDNKDVLRYYSENPVDLFLNVSESEGLPVSIMEAISFGIPCIATDVGGTSEAILDREHCLLEKEFSSEDLKDKILSMLERSKDNNVRKNIRLFWEENFSAERNYTDFTEFLLLLDVKNDE